MIVNRLSLKLSFMNPDHIKKASLVKDAGILNTWKNKGQEFTGNVIQLYGGA